MWHLFDKYKGVVWPKAGQLNLIARILNNLCSGTGIKVSTPTNPSPSAPVSIGIDTKWLDDYIGKIPSGGGGAGHDLFAWDAETRTIGSGYVVVGYSTVQVAAHGPLDERSWGDYSLKVMFAVDGTVSVTFDYNSYGSFIGNEYGSEQIVGGPSYAFVKLPLYSFDQNWNVTDMRCAFIVPAWS